MKGVREEQGEERRRSKVVLLTMIVTFQRKFG